MKARRLRARQYSAPVLPGERISLTTEVEEYGVWKRGASASGLVRVGLHIEVNSFFDPVQQSGGGGLLVVTGPREAHSVQVFSETASLTDRAARTKRGKEGGFLVGDKEVSSAPWESSVEVLEGGGDLVVRVVQRATGDVVETVRVPFPHTGKSLWRSRSEAARRESKHVASTLRWVNFMNKETERPTRLIERGMLSFLVSKEGGFGHLLHTVPWIQEAVAYADLQEHHLYHLLATLLWLNEAGERGTGAGGGGGQAGGGRRMPAQADFDHVSLAVQASGGRCMAHYHLRITISALPLASALRSRCVGLPLRITCTSAYPLTHPTGSPSG